MERQEIAQALVQNGHEGFHIADIRTVLSLSARSQVVLARLLNGTEMHSSECPEEAKELCRTGLAEQDEGMVVLSAHIIATA